MRIPDVNVLLSGRDQAAIHHATAREWLETMLSGSETVGLTWIVLRRPARGAATGSLLTMSPERSLPA